VYDVSLARSFLCYLVKLSRWLQ